MDVNSELESLDFNGLREPIEAQSPKIIALLCLAREPKISTFHSNKNK